MKIFNKFALLANRILYTIYEVWTIHLRFTTWIVDWTFGRPLYNISFIREKINKRYGVENYKSLKKRFKIPKLSFRYNKPSLFIFILPISLLFNVATIIIGNPLKLLYTKSYVFNIILIVTIILLSTLLAEHFFWRKERYQTFFSTFKNEKLIIRIAWIVGTFVTFVLLSVVNIKLFYYIIEAHK